MVFKLKIINSVVANWESFNSFNHISTRWGGERGGIMLCGIINFYKEPTTELIIFNLISLFLDKKSDKGSVVNRTSRSTIGGYLTLQSL